MERMNWKKIWFKENRLVIKISAYFLIKLLISRTLSSDFGANSISFVAVASKIRTFQISITREEKRH